MYKITDSHNKELNKQQIDELFKALNKELRKKMRNQPKSFKAETTKSYTNAIVYNSCVYKEYDRLVVRMVNLDLLLAMKLMSFRTDRKSDLADIKSIISRLRSNGMDVGKEYMQSLILKYYDSFDGLTFEAKEFLGMED